MKIMAAGNLQFLSSAELAVVKGELFDQYVRDMIDFVSPVALRTEAVRCTSQLARSLLGSAGGVGCDWGVSTIKKFHAEDNPDPAKVCAPRDWHSPHVKHSPHV